DASVRGAGYLYPLPMRFINDRLLLLRGDRRAPIGGWLKIVDVNLDKISSVPELYPHLLASFIRRVHKVEITRSGGRSPHAFRCSDHPRARADACVDGGAKVHIRRPAARQVSRRGEARLQVELRIFCGQECEKRRGKRRAGLNDERHCSIRTGV